MNYPIDSLTYIAPILFIVLMIAFPVIGVFGGWKRAVYWGGGNFLFYIIGMLIWTFAGQAICHSFTPLLESLMEGTGVQADLSNITASVLAPVFFLIVLIIANLLLLINYYAWYKRVVGLKKYKTIEKKDKDGKVVKVQVKSQAQLTKTGKLVNMLVGGVAMTALMLPTTFAFSEAVMMSTTSAATRKDKGLATGVYNTFTKVDNAFSWMSYYSGGSLRDFDALFATLSLLNSKVTLEDGTEVSTIEGVEKVFADGFGDIVNATTKGGGIDDVKAAVNDMAKNWNNIMDQAGTDVSSVMNSENATALIQQVINSQGGGSGPTQITSIDAYKEGGVFDQAVQEYKNGGMTQFQTIDVNQDSYNNMKTALINQFDLSALSDSDKQIFEQRMDEMLGIMFV